MNLKEQFTKDMKTAIEARKRGHHIVFGYLGCPGIGKTQIMNQVAQELGYEMASHFNIAASSPMDIQIKIPDMENGTFTTLASDDFPWADTVGDRKIVMCIDEMTNGTSDTIKAIQRLVNERKLGAKVLGENVIVVLLGNRQSDKAGSGTLSTAMYNRVTWRDIEWTAQNSDTAVTYILNKYKDDTPACRDANVLFEGYFAHKPMIMKDATDAVAKLGKEAYVQWCSPRSLEALVCRTACNNWQLPEIMDMAGDIGLGRAVELDSFGMLLGKMAKYEKVVAEPDTTLLPDSIEVQYAMLTNLAMRVKKHDFDKVWTYVSRIKEVTMRVMFMKMSLKYSFEITESKTYENLYSTDKQLVAALSAA